MYAPDQSGGSENSTAPMVQAGQLSSDKWTGTRMQLAANKDGNSLTITSKNVGGCGEENLALGVGNDTAHMKLRLYPTETYLDYSLDDGATWSTLTPTNQGGQATVDNVRILIWGYLGQHWPRIDSISLAVLPEPATLGLLVVGGLAVLKRRRR